MLYVSVVDVDFFHPLFHRVNEKIHDQNPLVEELSVYNLGDSWMIMLNVNVRYLMMVIHNLEVRINELWENFLVKDVVVSVVQSIHVHGLMMEQEDESNVEQDYLLKKEEEIYLKRERNMRHTGWRWTMSTGYTE
jgi:hypothetical protein